MAELTTVRCQWNGCGTEFATTTQSHAKYCPACRTAAKKAINKIWEENHKPQCKLRMRRHYRLECIRRTIEKYTVEELASMLRYKKARIRKTEESR